MRTKKIRSTNTETDSVFLVRLRDGFFFCGVSEGSPLGTEFPSFAEHLSYEVADDLASALRRKHYELAIVCNRYGDPVSAQDLKLQRVRWMGENEDAQ